MKNVRGTMKRMLGFFLCIVMVLTSVPPTAYAAEVEEEIVVGDNIITNSTFETWTDGAKPDDWSTYDIGNATFTKNANGGIDINVNSVGANAWDIQLYKQPLTFEAGKRYKVTVNLVSTVERSVVVQLEQVDGLGNTGGTHVVSADAEQKIEFTTDTVSSTLSNVKLYMGFGNVGANASDLVAHTITIKSVSVIPIGGSNESTEESTTEETPVTPGVSLEGNIITNPIFESGLDGWQLLMDGGVAANGNASTGMAVDITTTGGNEWGVQLSQPNMTFPSGTYYEVTVDLMSTIERNVKVALEDYAGNSGTKTYGFGTKTLSAGARDSITFTTTSAPEADTAAGKLYIALGAVDGIAIAEAHTVTIYSVNVIPIRREEPSTEPTTAEATTEEKNNEVVTIEGNIITDPTFVNGTASWSTYGVTPTINGDGGLDFAITNVGSDDWSVQLSQPDLTLKKGKKYTVNVELQSTAARTVYVALQDYQGDVNTKNLVDDTVELAAGTKKDIVLVTDTISNTISNGKLYIGLGKVSESDALLGNHTVTIKKVTVIESEGDSFAEILVWSDEFDGNYGNDEVDPETGLNLFDWSYDIGDGSANDNLGWGNDEWQYYTSETDNISVEDGLLTITAKREDREGNLYTSARIKTKGKQSFTYGKMEARIRLDSAQGNWPAFKMLGESFDTEGWPSCGEIDIMEWSNKNIYTIGELHWTGSNGDQEEYKRGYSSDGIQVIDVSEWHTYAVEWDESEIRWLIDDIQFFSVDISDKTIMSEFHQDQFILLNVAVGGSLTGNIVVEDEFPTSMYVDYVRVYQDRESNRVSFNSDGGSAVSSRRVTSGDAVSKPADPTKEGYRFLGWYIGDIEYDFETPVTEEITLTAKWEALLPEETPSARVDYKASQLKGLVSNASYSITIGDGSADDYTADASGKIAVNDINIKECYGKTIRIIKKGNGNTTYDSVAQELPVKSPASAEDASEFELTQAVNGATQAILVKAGKSGLTTAYEYSIDGGSLWTPGADDAASQIDVSFGAKNIWVRKAATENEPESQHTVLEAKKAQIPEGIPTASVDYKASQLKGLVSNAEYIITIGGGSAQSYIADVDGKILSATINIKDYYAKNITIIKKGNGDTTYDSVAQVITVLSPADAESKSEFTLIQAVNGATHATLVKTGEEGLTTTYEYSIDGGSTWTEGLNDAATQIDVSSDAKTIWVRKAATETEPESQHTILQAKKAQTQETKPSASVDYKESQLKNLVANAEYLITIGGGSAQSYTADVDGKIPSATINIKDCYGKNITIIKKGNGDTTYDSVAQVITVSSPVDAEDASEFTLTQAENGATHATLVKKDMSGLTTAYEYSIDGGSTWTTGLNDAASQIDVSSGAKTIWVRKEATETKPESQHTILQAKKAQIQEGTPYASVDYKESQLKGLVADAEYLITIGGGSAQSYTADANGKIAKNELLIQDCYGKNITIIKKGNGDTTYDSVAQEITVLSPATAEATSEFTLTQAVNGAIHATLVKTGEDGLTTAYEYSIDGGSIWTEGLNDVASQIDVSSGAKTIWVRKVATENEPESQHTVLEAKIAQTPEGMPSASVDYKESQLKDLVANATYSITIGEGSAQIYTTDANGKIAKNDILIQDCYGKNITLVKKGNGDTTYDSVAQVITVSSPADAEDASEFALTQAVNGATQATLVKTGKEGLTTDYEYSIDGGSTWTTGLNDAASQIDVSSGAKTIWVRKVATENEPESQHTVLEAKKAQTREDKPSASLDYKASQLKDLVANATYSIQIEGNAAQEVASDEDGKIPSATINIKNCYGKNITLVKKGNGDTTYDSVAQVITVSSPATAEAASAFTLTQAENGATHATLVKKDKTGLTTAYEYSIDGGSLWTPGVDDTASQIDVSSGAKTIWVRKAATENEPESQHTILQAKKAQTPEGMPTASVDYKESQLKGLVANATYSITIGDGEEQNYTADASGKIATNEINIKNCYGKTIRIIKKGNGNTTYNSVAQELPVKSPAEAEEASAFTLNQAVNGATQANLVKAGEDGLTTVYEYSIDEGSSWTIGLDNTASQIDVSLEGKTIRVRKAATENEPESEYTILYANKAQTQEGIPSASVDYEASQLKGLVSNANYSITIGDSAEQNYTADASGKIAANEINIKDCYGKTIRIIKKGNGNTTYNSVAQELTIKSPATAEDTSAFELTQAVNGATQAILVKAGEEGLTTAYEYSINDGSTWTTGANDAASQIDVSSGAKTIWVRKAAMETEPESEYTILYANKAQTRETTPGASVDYKASQLKGLVSNADYSITIGDGDAQNYTADASGKIAANEINIKDCYGKTIRIIKKGNGSTTYDSATQELPVKSPASAEDVSAFELTQAVNGATQAFLVKTGKSGLTTAYEYSIDGGSLWTPGVDDTASQIDVSFSAKTIWVRKAATEDEPESLHTVLEAKKAQIQEGTPSASVDYKESQLKGLVADAEYLITIGGGSAQSYTADANGKIPSATINIKNCYGKNITIVKKGNGDTTYDSVAQEITVLSPATAEAASELTLIQAVNGATHATLVKKDMSGLTTAYEYSINSGLSWTTGVDDAASQIDVSSGAKTIWVRKAATETEPESQHTVLEAKKAQTQETKPSASVDYKESQLKKLVANTEYLITIGGDSAQSYTADANGKIPSATINIKNCYGKNITIIKKGNGDTTYDSVAQEITVLSPATAESASEFTLIQAVNGATHATLVKKDMSGLTTAYEYSINSGLSWTTGVDDVASQIDVSSGAKTIWVRKAATEPEPESQHTVLQAKKAQEQEEIQNQGGITFNYVTQKLVGLEADNKYEISAQDVVVVTGNADAQGTINIANLSGYAGKELLLVKKGNGDTTYDSVSFTIQVADKPEKPSESEFIVMDPTAGENKGTIDGIKAEHEYSIDGGLNWTDGTGTIVDIPAGKNVQIRKKATETSPESEILVLTMGGQTEKTPESNINYITSMLEGLIAAADYIIKVDGALLKEVVAEADGTIEITSLPIYAGKVLEVIKKGTGNSSDSDAQRITVKGNGEAPSDDMFVLTQAVNGATQAQLIMAEKEGLTSAYEYSTNNGSTWTKGSDTETTKIDVASGAVEVWIRKAITEIEPESLHTVLHANKAQTREETPSASVDYKESQLKGLVGSAEYSIIIGDGSAQTYITDADGKLATTDINIKDYYGESITITKKGNGNTTYDSSAQELTVKNSAIAEDVSAFELTQAVNGATQAKLVKTSKSGLTIAYEYSTDAGQNWITGLEDEASRIDVESGAKTIWVRKAATETEPESNYTILQANKAQTQEIKPSASVDYKASQLKGLVGNATYSITIGSGSAETYTADVGGKIAVNKINIKACYGKNITIIKKGNGSSTYNSLAQELTIESPADAEDASAFELTQALNGATQATLVKKDKDGLTTAYEFSIDSGSTWITGLDDAASQIDVELGVKTIWVRKAATETEPESNYTILQANKAQTQETKPSASVDYKESQLKDLVGNATYGIAIGTTPAQNYIADVNGKITTINISDCYGKNITIIKKGNGSSTYDSPAQVIAVNSPATAEDTSAFELTQAVNGATQATLVKKDKNGLTTAYEFSIDSGSTWTTGLDDAASQIDVESGVKTIWVRKAATETEPESNYTILQANKAQTQETKPSASVDYKASQLKGLIGNAEYNIQIGENAAQTYTADADGKIATADINIKDYYGESIKIIKKGNGNTTYNSSVQELLVKSPTIAEVESAFALTQAVNGATRATLVKVGKEGLTTAYEYSINSGSTWTTGLDDAASQIDVESGAKTIWVRKVATETEPESAYTVLQAKKAHVQETIQNQGGITFNYATQKLVGLEADNNYVVSVEGTVVASRNADAQGTIDITDLSAYAGKEMLLVKKGDGDTTYDSVPFAIQVADKPEKPLEAGFIVTDPVAGENKGTIDGIQIEHEYSIDGGQNWTNGTGTIVDIPAGKNVQIRKKATKTSPESEILVLTMGGQTEKTPEANINYITSMLESLIAAADYIIRVDGTLLKEVAAEADGTIEITNLSSHAGKVLEVIKKGTDNSSNSDAQRITVKGNGEAPSDDMFVLTQAMNGATQAQLIKAEEEGLTSAYEYSTNNGSTWTKGSDTETTKIDVASGAVEVWIRKAVTETEPESLHTVLQAKRAQAQATIQNRDGITFNYATQELVGLEADNKYVVFVEGTVVASGNADAQGTIDITDLSAYAGKEIEIVKKGDGDSTYDSETFTIRVASKSEKPSADEFTVNNPLPGAEKGTINGITSIYEYSLNDGQSWATGTGTALEVPANENIFIRKKATETSPESETLVLTMGAKTDKMPETMPNATIDYMQSAVTGLIANAEYIIKLDGDNEISKTADADGRITIPELTSFAGKELEIIKKGTELSLDSEAQKIGIKTQSSAPEKESFTLIQAVNGATQATLTKAGETGLTTMYEYSMDGGSTWINGSDTEAVEMDVTAGGVEVWIRKKATENQPASEIVILQANKAQQQEEILNSDDITLNYAISKLEGLEAGKKYTICLENTVIAETVADEAGTIAIANLVSYAGDKLELVKKGDGNTTYDSESLFVQVAMRPEKPSTDVFTVTEAKAGEKEAVISGITSDYEYSLDDGATWMIGEDSEVKISAGDYILIRKKATEVAPESEPIQIVTESASDIPQEEKPEVKANYLTGKLAGFIPYAEYEIIVDEETNTVTADAEGTIDVRSYYGKTLYIVKKGDEITTSDSMRQVYTIQNQDIAPPENQFVMERMEDDENVIVINVTSDLEYSIDNGVNWNIGTGRIIIPIDTNVLIRSKATVTSPPSESVTIKATIYNTTAVMEQKILDANTDVNDVEGSEFGKLRLRATGAKKAIKLKWKKVKDADGYILYGSRCGQKLKKIKTFETASKKSYTHKKLKKGKYYKYMVVAYKLIDGKQYVITTSKTVHAATKGSKYGNPKKVQVKRAKITVKAKKKAEIKASYIGTTKKVTTHIAKFRYESANTKIATVTSKGVIKGVSRGRTTIYVYAQNGIYKTIKVKVR